MKTTLSHGGHAVAGSQPSQRRVGMRAIGEAARDQVHPQPRDTSRARGLKGTDRSEGSGDRFHPRPFAAHDRVHPANPSGAHRLATPREPLHALSPARVVSGLRTRPLVFQEGTDPSPAHPDDRGAIVDLARRERTRQPVAWSLEGVRRRPSAPGVEGLPACGIVEPR